LSNAAPERAMIRLDVTTPPGAATAPFSGDTVLQPFLCENAGEAATA
jgi:hypothetical protein